MSFQYEQPALLHDPVTGGIGYKNTATGKEVMLQDPASVAITGGTINGASVAAATVWPTRIAGFLGDSITNGSNAGNAVYAFPDQIVAMVGGQLLAYATSLTAGVPGERSDQIALRLPAMLAQGCNPVVILAGTNDASQSVAVGTYIANMKGMIAACKNAGAQCYVLTVPPRSASTATASTRQLTAAYNHWIRMIAPTFGATVVDAYAALVDVTTGDMLAAYDGGDGTHPNALGHRKIALAAAKQMLKSVSQASIVQSVSAYNLLPNPLMVGTTTPTSWFEWPGGTGTAPTYTCVADTSGFLDAGQWGQMAFNATAGGVRRLSTALSNTGWSVGDTLAVVGKLQIQDIAGNWETIATGSGSTGSVGVGVINADSGAGLLSNVELFTPGYYTGSVYNLGPMLRTFVVPAGVTHMDLWCSAVLPTGANANFRFGQMGVINLTALGLAAAIPS